MYVFTIMFALLIPALTSEIRSLFLSNFLVNKLDPILFSFLSYFSRFFNFVTKAKLIAALGTFERP